MRYKFIPLVLALTASTAFAACGDETPSNNNPDPTVSDSAVRDTTPEDTNGGGDTNVTPSDGGDTGTGTDAPWSLDSGKCFEGKPTKQVEYLNRCTTADKVKYTTKLTKLGAGGMRPPLP